jgi:LmbE family N-acetylglucosaminyl deacetylase
MPSALAIAAHPDDIEFGMAGTLLLLRERGWEIHYLNLSRGDLGSTVLEPRECARVRREEAQAAARLLGATWHPPMRGDLRIFYDDRTLRRLGAIVREVAPTIVLTHSLEDYMEDHMNTARLAVTAAFSRGMPNYRTVPTRAPVPGDVTIYHAQPHGHVDQMGRRIVPELWVDTTNVHATKRAALACHASQKEWLDASQGMDSYLVTMDELSREVARMPGGCGEFAEGWRRHSHLGFCAAEADPLRAALGK